MSWHLDERWRARSYAESTLCRITASKALSGTQWNAIRCCSPATPIIYCPIHEDDSWWTGCSKWAQTYVLLRRRGTRGYQARKKNPKRNQARGNTAYADSGIQNTLPYHNTTCAIIVISIGAIIPEWSKTSSSCRGAVHSDLAQLYLLPITSNRFFLIHFISHC